MRHYETIYIIKPDLTDEDCREVIKKFSNLIEKQKGVIVKVEEWGNQKLAYEVKKFDKGYYVLMNYCGEPRITAELERNLKLDDRVLKCQTVKLGEKVDPQALILKEKEAKKESAAPKDEFPEKEEAVPHDEKGLIQEVGNGV